MVRSNSGLTCEQAHLCEFGKNFVGSGRRLISKSHFCRGRFPLGNGHTDLEESENEKRRKNEELHHGLTPEIHPIASSRFLLSTEGVITTRSNRMN